MSATGNNINGYFTKWNKTDKKDKYYIYVYILLLMWILK